jgi:hypothetical protein
MNRPDHHDKNLRSGRCSRTGIAANISSTAGEAWRFALFHVPLPNGFPARDLTNFWITRIANGSGHRIRLAEDVHKKRL